MKKVKSKTGFSLLELSVVILLIGIIVAGISQGNVLRQNMSLNTARSLTVGSPVNAIPNLVAWYEPTLETSFNNQETIDGANINSWFDNSPTGENVANAGIAPTYVRYGINELPSIRFNGANSFLTFDHNLLVGRYYTIFIVERRSVGGLNNILGFGNGNDFRYNAANELASPTAPNFPVGAFGGEVPRILTFLSAPQIGNTKGTFVNGGNGNVAANAAADALINTWDVGWIGRTDVNFYNGDISEIIMFNRSLDIVERNAVQEYLSDKYKINITPSN